jgi:DNA-binding transcriptional LysR family regulator
MSKSIEIQNLQVFVAVAEERNMSNAAKKLGLTQSAISQSIRQIEENFGVVLINRERRPLSLTAAGLALKNRAVVLLSEMNHLRSLVIDASRGIKPDLRIGLVDSFAGTIGPLFVQQLLPHSATLSVETGLSPYHGESLLARDLDVAVSTEPLVDFDNIWRQRLLSERFIVITPPDCTAHVRGVEGLRQLADSRPIVRFNRSSHMGSQIERLLRRIDVRVPYKLEIDRADNVTSMVAAGSGWAITTPMCMMQAGDVAKHVRIQYLGDCTGDRSLYLLGRRGEYDKLLQTFATIAYDLLLSNLAPHLDAIDPKLKSMVDFSVGIPPTVQE